MSDRVPSDHDAVSAYRTHLEPVGRTNRLRVPLPDDLGVAAGDRIRLSLEGDGVYASVEDTLEGTPCLTHAADNQRLARTGDGENRLTEWIAALGLGPGDPLKVDEVTAGYTIGLRRPGERVVYTAVEPPSDSLSDIASDLGE